MKMRMRTLLTVCARFACLDSRSNTSNDDVETPRTNDTVYPKRLVPYTDTPNSTGGSKLDYRSTSTSHSGTPCTKAAIAARRLVTTTSARPLPSLLQLSQKPPAALRFTKRQQQELAKAIVDARNGCNDNDDDLVETQHLSDGVDEKELNAGLSDKTAEELAIQLSLADKTPDSVTFHLSCVLAIDLAEMHKDCKFLGVNNYAPHWRR